MGCRREHYILGGCMAIGALAPGSPALGRAPSAPVDPAAVPRAGVFGRLGRPAWAHGQQLRHPRYRGEHDALPWPEAERLCQLCMVHGAICACRRGVLRAIGLPWLMLRDEPLGPETAHRRSVWASRALLQNEAYSQMIFNVINACAGTQVTQVAARSSKLHVGAHVSGLAQQRPAGCACAVQRPAASTMYACAGIS